jgi:hypothetical protein
MVAAIRAGIAYAIVVFLIGFGLGTFRVLLLIPQVGETVAVSLETPLMLAASWFVCRWCVDLLDVPRRVGARAVMGVVAFTVLMLAEFGLSALVFGRSEAEFAASYASVSGAIGLVAQIIFAIFPAAQIWRHGD